MADSTDPIQQPQDWDKVVSVAYLRILGHSQVDAAKGVGVGERSVVRWEQCSWWHKAVSEASDRWLSNLTAQARSTLLDAIKEGDADKALKILERTDPRLAPARHGIDLRTPDGIQVEQMSDEALQKRATELTNRVAALTQNTNGDGGS